MTSDKTSQIGPEVMTPDEVAFGLQVSLKTVARLLRKGEIHGIKVGGQWRVPRTEYERILKPDEAELTGVNETEQAA